MLKLVASVIRAQEAGETGRRFLDVVFPSVDDGIGTRKELAHEEGHPMTHLVFNIQRRSIAFLISDEEPFISTTGHGNATGTG